MRKFMFTLIGIGSLVSFSCSEDSINDEQTKKASFIDVTSENQILISGKKQWWVIADWDWGRESRQCKSGFGVCHWDWFPGWKLSTTPAKEGKVRTPILFDDTLEKHYVEFLLEKNSLREEFLIIDQDISMDVTIDNETENITFPAGKYYYNSSMGKNGGYKVVAK